MDLNKSLLSIPLRIQINTDRTNQFNQLVKVKLIDHLDLLDASTHEAKVVQLIQLLENKEVKLWYSYMMCDAGSEALVLTDHDVRDHWDVASDYLYLNSRVSGYRKDQDDYDDKWDGHFLYNEWDGHEYDVELFNCHEVKADQIVSFKVPNQRELQVLNYAYNDLKFYSHYLEENKKYCEGKPINYVTQTYMNYASNVYATLYSVNALIARLEAAKDIADYYWMYYEKKWISSVLSKFKSMRMELMMEYSKAIENMEHK